MRQQPTPQQPPGESAYAPADFFVMRAPLLSFDQFLAWSTGLSAPGCIHNPSALTAALAADRAQWRGQVREALTNPELREALYVASPDLEASLSCWLAQPESERGQKVERTLARYLPRMAGRATPFGLFAGWSVGAIAAQSRLDVAPCAACVRHTRLDMDYLFALSDGIVRDPALRPALRFRPNSSCYPTAGQLRYIETRLQGRSRSHHLVAVEISAELLATLERATHGATAADLAAALVAADEEIAPDEAAAYIDALIDSQLLMADLEPTISGAEPIHGMIDRLSRHPLTAPLAGQLDTVRQALARLDAGGLGASPEQYREIAAMLEGLPARAEPARLFQVDLARPSTSLSLGPVVIDAVARGVALLHRIAGPTSAGPLSAFYKAFRERYEDREVPLVEALDEESGVGAALVRTLGSDAGVLLGGLPFTAPGGVAQVAWTAGQAMLLRKVEAAARVGAHTIDLSEADLELLAAAGPADPLPDSIAALVTLVAPSAEALEQGDVQIFLQSAGGPSGARLLGRFCHADPALHNHVAALLRAEESLDPDALFAEIVHLPEGRLGNVICRPTLRTHEIIYLGQSGAPQSRQIPISDLLISVQKNRITLRSARFGRRVVPRLSSAHNYRNGLGLYRFLGALQGHGLCAGVSWDWGALASAAFLPRVTVGNLILARARWRIDAAEIKELSAAAGAERFRAAQALRARRGLPRLVQLEDGDNELPLDLEHGPSIESLVELVKGRRSIALGEIFPGPEDLCATGGDGRYVHELVIPFTRCAKGQPAPADPPPRTPPRPASPRPIARSFPPGSEWLYARLACGTAMADRVLREVVAPVARVAEGAGRCDSWFFLRYSDPEPHLRVRFHGEPARLLAELAPALHAAAAPFVAEGLIWRMQLDTYNREVERYGGPEGVALAEQLFHADSAAALAIIEQYPGDTGAAQRWRLALCGIDQLFCALGFAEAERHSLIRGARDGYAREFHAGPMLKRRLGEKYRQQRGQIEGLLAPSGPHDPALTPGLAALAARNDQIAVVAASLREAARRGRLSVSLDELALSYAHMHVNRLLRSAPRRQEYVLYELLDRLYASRAAQLRQKRG